MLYHLFLNVIQFVFEVTLANRSGLLITSIMQKFYLGVCFKNIRKITLLY